MTRLVLRGGAVLDLALGIVLLAATWDSVYETLGLPEADPPLYAQLAGVALLAFAYLLWIAPRGDALVHAVSLAGALAHLLTVVIMLAWLLRGDVGGVVLWGLVPLFAARAALQARIASRSVAMLVPGD